MIAKEEVRKLMDVKFIKEVEMKEISSFP